MNRYVDSERRFQHVLEACGVNKSLSKLGVKEGDTVIVGDVSIDRPFSLCSSFEYNWMMRKFFTLMTYL